MTPQEKQEFNEMKAFIESLKSSSTIPLQVDAAFRDRFSNIGLGTSSKTAASEIITVVTSVNFGASSVTTASVARAMDGFLDAGNGNNVPTYDS